MERFILLAAAILLASGCATPPRLQEGADMVQIAKSDPPQGSVYLQEISAIDGEGCGGFGYKGSYANAVIRLRNEALKIGSDYVQIMAAGGCAFEQDADIVMFIHREDKGKDESEKTNIAEILIEKHRNGPVGKVDLYFDEKSTTFMSIEKTSMNQFASSISSGGVDAF